MVDFKPFQSPGVDLGYFKECRKYFSLAEWIDLLVSSCQFNPEIHTISEKMLNLAKKHATAFGGDIELVISMETGDEEDQEKIKQAEEYLAKKKRILERSGDRGARPAHLRI